MLNINKHTVLNDKNEITSVIIEYKDYLMIEEIFENYSLSKFIDENEFEEYLDRNSAMEFYPNIKR